MKKKIIVTKELDTGRNVKFLDKTSHNEMSRTNFVKKIKDGEYPGYHVRVVNNIPTPCSNPDRSTNNNLG